MKVMLVMSLGLLFVANASVLADDSTTAAAIKEELGRLQGTWKVVSYEFNGKKATDAEREAMTGDTVIDGDTLAVLNDGERVWKGSMTIDPSKYPKTLDVVITEGMEDLADERKKMLGIYELDGNSLTICTTAAGDPDPTRPEEFETKVGQHTMLFVFQRLSNDAR